MIKVFTESVRRAASAILDIRKQPLEITTKGDRDFLTAADSLSQKIILEILSKEFPGVLVVAEEDESHEISSSTYITVDPIDGTFNFSCGSPDWAVTIGFVENGQPKAGVIFVPDQDILVEAEANKGCRINGNDVLFAKPPPLKHCIVGSEVGWYVGEKLLKQKLLPLAKHSLGVRSLLSACVGSVDLLRGRTRAFVHPRGGKIWDFAAATIAVTEAGGFAASIDGTSINWQELYLGVVYAASEELAQEIFAAFGAAD